MPRPPKPAGTTADQVLAVRLTTADHALVGELVAHHRTELSKLHVAGSVTPADVIRTLLRREAERVGLRKADPATQPTPVSPAPQPPDPTRPEPGEETPEPPPPPPPPATQSGANDAPRTKRRAHPTKQH